jgi:hypothetical protein
MRLLLTVVVAAGTLGVLFKTFFRDRHEFAECVRFWFTPDAISLLRGEYFEDRWAQIKILVWLALGFVAGWSSYTLLG